MVGPLLIAPVKNCIFFTHFCRANFETANDKTCKWISTVIDHSRWKNTGQRRNTFLLLAQRPASERVSRSLAFFRYFCRITFNKNIPSLLHNSDTRTFHATLRLESCKLCFLHFAFIEMYRSNERRLIRTFSFNFGKFRFCRAENNPWFL